VRAFVLGLLVCGVAAPAALPQELAVTPAAPVSVTGYVVALERLLSHLEAGRLDAARSAARDLSATEIVWGDETLTPDPTVLEAVGQMGTEAEARPLAARVRRLVKALGGDTGRGAVTARPDVLSRVTPGPDIEKGGEAPRLQVKPLTFPEKVEAALVAVADWIGDTLRRIRDWLRRLMPRRTERAEGDAGMTATVAVAFAVVAAALLVILAWRSLRRGAVGPTDALSVRTVSSSRDEDPLSREAKEWEEYARDLAAKKRWREAIRAWYHAVLVTLFRSGVLHHQRGRTNWEYASRLSPRLTWRPGFIALTRRFDREWYGRRTSDGAALSECAREAREVLHAVRGPGDTA
jgi:hypothetical protein